MAGGLRGVIPDSVRGGLGGPYMAGAFRAGQDLLTDKLGGPARVRVILVLAAILSVDGVDKGAVGALAPQLETSLGIGNPQVGLLVAISSTVGALAALPVGVLADRTSRTVGSQMIAVWCPAQ